MAHYTVYQVTNLINDKVYIGAHKTTTINDRYMGSGIALRHAINKYGISHFKKEILYIFDNPDDMFAKERELVDSYFVKRNDTYNLIEGGLGGSGIRHTVESKKRISDALRNRDPAIRAKAAQKMQGHAYWGVNSHTEQTKDRMSESRKQFYANLTIEERKEVLGDRSGVNNSFYGKTHTEESKTRMSDWKKENYQGTNNPFYGKTHSVETKRKLSEKSKEGLEYRKLRATQAMKGKSWEEIYGIDGAKQRRDAIKKRKELKLKEIT